MNLLAKVVKWLYLKVEYPGYYSSGIIRYVYIIEVGNADEIAVLQYWNFSI